MATPPTVTPEPPSRSLDPFRRAVLRGLGVVLPPLLTVVIFIWVGGTVSRYVLTPLEDATRYVLVEYVSDIRRPEEFGEANPGETAVDAKGKVFHRAPDELYISDRVYTEVEKRLRKSEAVPATARDWVRRYVNDVWLVPWIVVPIFLLVFLLLLYAVGKFLAAGIGRFFHHQFESLITRVPLVSNVYTSVKQVTDFAFTEPDLDISRIVAVEYPRQGIWSIAFATGESMLDIEAAANEPVMSVLIPTSPMPFTGFTITVKKSETIDMNLTMDQALQFIFSCGVVVPPHQITRAINDRRGVDGAPPDTSAYGLAMGNPPLKGMAHPHGAVGSGPVEADLHKDEDD
ncbi:DUF502 domain-containing protein [Botrimarina mediterranea]|uniref:DUF502 domain-containing protein n=1 Tax=Botrimarina mediterranea TaxID=2528022 RepID=A0A518K4F5_9BACT|nr:DUF502 domain-containing protein [Botrimarina mediterranea]QDV72681.1 hypothetical protein Spa11_08620 [Botrimarina mediterranea]QDV77253.1 hypothetical protein K2D_08430 [Planctomycetes bacterium K2D]